MYCTVTCKILSLVLFPGLFCSAIEDLTLDQTAQLVWQHASELRRIFEGKVKKHCIIRLLGSLAQTARRKKNSEVKKNLLFLKMKNSCA